MKDRSIEQFEGTTIDDVENSGECSERNSAGYAAKLIGCYRIKDVVSPQIYIDTIAEKFAMFDDRVCVQIISNITSKQKFPPAPAEVVAEGEAVLVDMRIKRNAAKQMAKQEAARDTQKIEGPKPEKFDHVKLKDKYEELGIEYPGEDDASWTTVIMYGAAKEDDERPF